MKTDLVAFIHVAKLEGVEARLQEYLQSFERTGLLDALQQVFLCTVGESTLQYTPINPKISIQNVSKNLEDFEVPTQQALWEYAKEHSNAKILYLHTKGVGKNENQCIEDWVQYMSYFCIDKWPEAVEKLDTYDTTGVDLLQEPTLHYSGNFWWARASYIQTLPCPVEFANLERYPNPLNSIRHNQEFWICYKKQNHFCFWQSNINCYHRHVNLYPRSKYVIDKTVEKSICIFFLTANARQFIFPQIAENISKCQNKHKIKLLILTDPDDNPERYVNTLMNKNIDYDICVVPHENNYMNKASVAVQYAESNNIPYLMKHDNDVLCSPYLYDYLFENLKVLDDPKNLALTPTLTSGIPTVEQFIDDFCSPQEKQELYDIFLRYAFGHIWGVDFTPLNKHTLEAKTWNAYEFFKGVKDIPHHYKGIHPIRVSEEAIFRLNDIVLSRRKEIMEERKISLVYDNFSPYFCNSIYLIKRDIYNTILKSKELFVDPFDEVALNKYRDNHNLNIVYTQNGAAIHIIYNGIPHHGIYEQLFMIKYNELQQKGL